MTNPQILVIILVLVALGVYFSKNNSNQPNISDNSSQISELKSQIQHYQTLYQKRVEKDLEVDQSEKIRELVASCQNLESNLAEETQTKNLFQQKIGSLETQLINLAQQKVKGKKEAEKLIKELESNWKQDKELWKDTETDYLGKLTEIKKDQSQKERTIIGLNQSYDKLDKKFKEKEKSLKKLLLNKLDSFLEKN